MRFFRELLLPLISLFALLYGFDYVIKLVGKRSERAANMTGYAFLPVLAAFMFFGPFPALVGLGLVLLLFAAFFLVFKDNAILAYCAIVGPFFLVCWIFHLHPWRPVFDFLIELRATVFGYLFS